jgi:hypothetical protein
MISCLLCHEVVKRVAQRAERWLVSTVATHVAAQAIGDFPRVELHRRPQQVVQAVVAAVIGGHPRLLVISALSHSGDVPAQQGGLEAYGRIARLGARLVVRPHS